MTAQPNSWKTSSRTMRFALSVMGIVAGLGLLEGRAVAQQNDLLLVEVAPVQRLQLSDPIKSLGTLRPRESVDITATVSDKVKTIHVDDGAYVETGDLLVSLESAEERAAVDAARALVTERKLAYDRAADLARRQSGPLALAEERKAAFEQAKAQLDTALARLADREIRAPFSGWLGFKQVSPGSLIRPADVIFSLWATDQLYLDFTVSDRHLAALSKGLVVTGRTNAYPDKAFEGVVALINPAVDTVSRAVKVRAVIDNHNALLKPGMAMEVRLEKAPRSALIVPEEALVPSDQGQRVFTVIPDGNNQNVGAVGQQIVVIGSRRPGAVEVLGGVDEGQFVVTRGTMRVRVGQQVRFRTPQAEMGAGQ